MRQLALDLPALARDPAATHVEVASQAAVRRALSAWREWPSRMLAMVGPEGSGKSHLAALWAREAGAEALAGAPGEPLSGPMLYEDADRAPNADRWLLALIDGVRDGRSGPLLLTSRMPPSAWPVSLADLASRLALLPVAVIDDPTDEDLAAVFAKQLGDRGVEASPALLAYVVRRIERSFEAAQKAAQVLDKIALERKQRISRKLAVEVLGDGAVEGPEDADER